MGHTYYYMVINNGKVRHISSSNHDSTDGFADQYYNEERHERMEGDEFLKFFDLPECLEYYNKMNEVKTK